MKTILIILLVLGLYSCGLNIREDFIDNINKLKRPILVYRSKSDGSTYFFTFIDADGKIYISPETGVEFPDTIK